MERYDSYKDSGVEWIGEIPSHWACSPLYTKSRLTKEKNTDSEQTVLSLSYGKIVVRDIETNYGLLPESFDSYQRIRPGNVILRLTDLQNDKNSLRVGISRHHGIITSAYLSVRGFGDLINDFLFYYLQESDSRKVLYSLGSGLRQTLRFEELGKMKVLTPPPGEQEQIVEYLDRKTALIDSLIEKTVRKIALLKEKRTSLINEVVTKGLNPDVEMKDSRVEWIGEIPSHWEVSKVKYNFTFRGGSTPSTEADHYWNGDIPWVSSKDVKTKYIHNTEDRVSSLGVQNSSCSILPIDSLIMVVRSGILQRTIPIAINKVELVVNQDQKAMIPKGGTLTSWFYYFVKGNENRLLKDWVKEGTTVESIEMDYLLNHLYGIPPLSEQEQIVEYLDEQTSIIDSTITKEEKRIELLKEYRQSLISEVVTGKAKVANTEHA